MIKVLFTGGGGAGSEAIWRLYSKVYDVHFADANINSINPIIPVDNCHEIPWANDANFVSKLNNFCKLNKINLLVPGVDEELYIIIKNKIKFFPTEIMLPNIDFIKIMTDKYQMIKNLKKFKLSLPYTVLLNGDYSKIHFPCILKPRKGRGSRGVRIIKNRTDIGIIQNAKKKDAKNYIIQDKIVGQEYTVQVVADKKGNLLAIIPIRVLSKKGITIDAEIEKNINVIKACELIHQANNAEGCYNIQLILTNDGKVFPFEINPRISTTFCLVLAAKIDPIKLFLSGNKLTNNSFKEGIKLKRFWSNHFLTDPS